MVFKINYFIKYLGNILITKFKIFKDLTVMIVFCLKQVIKITAKTWEVILLRLRLARLIWSRWICKLDNIIVWAKII